MPAAASRLPVMPKPVMSELVADGLVPPAPGVPGADAIAALERDGVVLLRGAVGAQWLAPLEDGIDTSIAARGPDSYTVAAPGEPGFFFTDTFLWRRLPAFRAFAFGSPVADLARALLRSETLTFYFDFLLVKEPGTSRETPWHQDHSYWPVTGRQICNVWTALDHIPRETGLRFVRGSHRFETLYRAVSFDPGTRHPDEIRDRPVPPDFDDGSYDILGWDMAPGDALVWYSRTLHSAPGNRTARRRRALSTCWFGDDVRYHAIPEGTGPPSRGEGLVEGGRMACETFPQVR